jgi:hypothetical protein
MHYLYAYFDNLVRRYATPYYFAISERKYYCKRP